MTIRQRVRTNRGRIGARASGLGAGFASALILGMAIGLLFTGFAMVGQPAFAQDSGTQKLLDLLKAKKEGGAKGEAPVDYTDTGDVVVLEVTGESSYRPKDAARSRREAIEAAQREAVEQASGVIIESQSMLRNFELVEDEVLSKSRGFIRKYKVLKQGMDGPLYSVTIRAEVVKKAFIGGVNESLAALYKRVDMPRVMLVVEEDTGFGTEADLSPNLRVLEKEMRKILLKQGFTFIDARSLKDDSLLKKAGRDRSQLVDAAKTSKADILMIGNGQAGQRTKMNSFHVVESNVGLDVIRVDNGQIMASEVVSGKGLNVNENTAVITSLQKAARDITPAVMEQVTFLWLKERNEGAVVEMVVKGISFRQLKRFRSTISNEIGGVKKVDQRSYSKGVAQLELTTRKSTDRLAEDLSETKFNGFVLDILDVSRSGLVVSVRKVKKR